jgi:integrase
MANRAIPKLGLPDLEHAKSAVLVSLRSPESQRSYRRSIDDFVGWYCSEPRLSFSKAVVTRYRIHLEDQLLAPGTINVRPAAVLTIDHIQRREDHWAIVDLVGKGGHIRTVPMLNWVKQTIDDWLTVAKLEHGKIFRCVCRKDSVWGTAITEKVVWHVVKEYAKRWGVTKLVPHDLRRSRARLCHESGGELSRSNVSVQTTEKYLGCKQRFQQAVNDRLGIEPRTELAVLRIAASSPGRQITVRDLSGTMSTQLKRLF